MYMEPFVMCQGKNNLNPQLAKKKQTELAIKEAKLKEQDPEQLTDK